MIIKSGGEIQVAENLRVVTGAAEYGRLAQEVLQVGQCYADKR